MNANYEIYTGVWTDWSYNKVLGSTLTTTRTQGGLLIAFLSLFVAVIGTSFWKIFCFILHYIYSTEASRDAMYHQRQAILRNAANASSGITSLFMLFNAWRKTQPKKTYQRILPLLVFSCLILAAFAAASTFSSKVSTTGNAVLLSSTNCGFMYPYINSSTSTEYTTVFQPYNSQRLTSNANYAQECYGTYYSTGGCNTFVKRQLSSSITRNASCPFPGDICKSQDSNLLLDTGLVDSHDDLGLNARPEHRYQFRLVLQAAPLETQGYTGEVPSLGPGLHDPYAQYYYGPRLAIGVERSNYTYQHKVSRDLQFYTENFTSTQPGMDINVMTAQYTNGSLYPVLSNFAPIKELERTDADLYLAFISMNALQFPEKSDDLWYPAHRPALDTTSVLVDEPISAYWSDEPASPMGLVLQYQFCRPGLPVESRCTPLLAFTDAGESAARLWGEEEMADGFSWFIGILTGPQDPLMEPIKVLGQESLDSRSLMLNGLLGPLRENQWQLDVERWNNISLASMQQSFVQAATGPPDPEQNQFLMKPQSDLQKKFCKNQKVLSTAYTNFSILGLSLILSIGGFIIILSYTLEPLVIWIQHRRNLDVYARLEWTMNETLQLQRLAHEELGLGTWHRCDTEVPVTEKLDRLGVLDLSEKSHPKLKAPPPGLEEILRGGSGDRIKRDEEPCKNITQEACTEIGTPTSPSLSDSSSCCT